MSSAPGRYTAHENYTDAELVKLAAARHDDPLLSEIAQRFEEFVEQAEDAEDVDLREELDALDEHVIDTRAVTYEILDALTEAGVTCVADFERIIEERDNALDALEQANQAQTGDTDMSLELALNENTAAMRELTALLKGGVMPMPAANDKGDAPAETPQPATKAKPAAKTEKPKAADPAPTIDRDALAKKVVEFGRTKGRDQALALLAKFNAKNLNSVPDDKLPELEAELSQATAA